MFKKTLRIFNIFLIFVFFSLYAHATDSYGFKTVDLSDNEIEMVWNNTKIEKININSLSDCTSSIVSFDVSENEYILLGLKDNIIIIADKNGCVLNSLKFVTDGTYYVKWEDRNFLLMLVRSSLIIELTPEGQLVDIIQTDDNDVDNSKLWRAVKQKEISVNDSNYVLRNKFGPFNIISSSYSQLIRIDSVGNESIIYDVNTQQLIKTSLSLIFVVAFFICAIYYVFRPTKNNQSGRDSGTRQQNTGQNTGDGSMSRSEQS